MFYWLESMTVVLSFLKIFSLRKTIAYFFNISENLQENQGKSYISGISWAFKIKLQILDVATLQILDVATYIAMFLPDSNNCFLICLIRYVYICFYYFLIFCSCFRLAKPAIHYFIHPPPPPPLYTTRSPMRAEEEVCAAEGCHNKALTKEGCESKLGTYLAPFARTACYIQYF